MKNFVRIIGIILLLCSTAIFILKIWIAIPIEHSYLFGLFFIGAISLFWANYKDSKELKQK